MNTDNTPNYRFEVKIPIPLNRLEEVRIWLMTHTLWFKPHFPDRDVNSLYLDTPHLERYEENLSGISVRKKVRIRWYNQLDDANKAKLEFKHRQGGKGYKVTFDTQFDFDDPEFSWAKALKLSFDKLPEQGRILWGVEHTPVLICRYTRQYFISNCQKIRATFDKNICVYDQRYKADANLHRSVPLGDYVLLELKADAEFEKELSRLLATCPLRQSRHSKYVNGIRQMMWQ